jgi:hypothetical protein
MGETMNLYNDGTGKWHTQTMERYRDLDIESLKYIMFDCRQALNAMPDNPKAEQYMDEIHYCLMELARRRINAFKK